MFPINCSLHFTSPFVDSFLSLVLNLALSCLTLLAINKVAGRYGWSFGFFESGWIKSLESSLVQSNAENKQLTAELARRDAAHKKLEGEWANRYSGMNETLRDCDDKIGHLAAAVTEEVDKRAASEKTIAGLHSEHKRLCGLMEFIDKARAEYLRDRDKARAELAKAREAEKDYVRAINELRGLLGEALGMDHAHLIDLLYRGDLTPDYLRAGRDQVEKRVHASHSKGYALGFADAREKVREVLAAEPE